MTELRRVFFALCVALYHISGDQKLQALAARDAAASMDVGDILQTPLKDAPPTEDETPTDSLDMTSSPSTSGQESQDTMTEEEKKEKASKIFPHIDFELRPVKKEDILDFIKHPAQIYRRPKSKPKKEEPANITSEMKVEEVLKSADVFERRNEPKILNIRRDFRYHLPVSDVTKRNADELKKIVRKDISEDELLRKAPTILGNCGGLYTGIKGLVGSPNHPHKYPNDLHCQYDIEVDLNYTLQIKCPVVSIQLGHGECEFDYLEVIWEEEYGQQISARNTQFERFCGTQTFEIHSTSNKATIIFHSDSEYRYSGFLCKYNAIDENGLPVLEAVENPVTPSGIDLCSFENGETGVTKCGISNKGRGERQPRVAGGITTNAHDFPWKVAVLIICGPYFDEYCHICGGSIIHHQFILTAAHCVYGVDIELLGLLMGDHNLYTLTPSQKFSRVSEVHTHPDFNFDDGVFNSNVALLKTPQRIDFALHNIAPVCLPMYNPIDFLNSLPEIDRSHHQWASDNSYYDKDYEFHFSLFDYLDPDIMNPLHDDLIFLNVTLPGWGYINRDEDMGEELSTVSITILPSGVCQYYYNIMTPSLMCCSSKLGIGPCVGDSGSPLMMSMIDGRWVLVALQFFGSIYCGIEHPSVSTLIAIFMDWITLVTQADFYEFN